MVELEIDGKKVQIEEGASIIEAADQIGIYIPRYCYHKKLSVAANCRMCLVEVEKVGKPLPACATPVTSEMKVFTRSDKALEAQRAVMEFLLINHPLDCPICDQGGECELQDLAMGYGSPYSYYEEGKRSVYDDDLGPLIDTCMTRCIQCTRCVRFGEEIAGLRELGVTNRGEQEKITTYVKHFMRSELSGNIIDLCPVGALTSKPFQYSARGWELTEHPTVAPHDCVGSNIFIHTRGQEYVPQRFVMRVVPRQNEQINETWISDRDRFSYQALHHQERIFKPRMKKNGVWVEVEWQDALVACRHTLQKLLKNAGPEQFATLAWANSTLEEFYLLQKLTRSLGSDNIDYRVRQFDFNDQDLVPEFPNLGMKIADLENLTAILLVGSNVRYEQPLLSHRINKAYQENASIFAINPADYKFIFGVKEKLIHSDIVQPLAEVAKALADMIGKTYSELDDIEPSVAAKAIAQALKDSEKAGLFIGPHAFNHPNASQIIALSRLIGKLSQTQVGAFTEGVNASGAWLAGAVPHRGPAFIKRANVGLNAKQLLTTNPVKGYLLFNLELEYDSAYAHKALQVLEQAEAVICLTPFVTREMERYADIILPITPFSETTGTFVNVEGTWQQFRPVSLPHGESRPGWKVLRVLANMLELPNFDYKSALEIHEELKSQVKTMPSYQPAEIKLQPIRKEQKTLSRLAPWHMYRIDPIVRRAKALQEVMNFENVASVFVNKKTAELLKFHDGDHINAIQEGKRLTLPLRIDNRLADNVVCVYSGLEQTAGFGEAFAAISLEREGA